MKTKLSIIFILLTTLLNAQYDSKGEYERSRFRAGMMWYYNGIRPAKPEAPRKYDRLIFDLCYNDWVGDRNPFLNHWSSIGLNTNWMFDIPLTKGNTVALGIGISHQLMHVRFDDLIVGDNVSGSTHYILKDTSDTYKKSIFGGNSFAVPLEIRFRKESWRHFKLHLGGRFGYQLNLFDKYIYKTDSGRDVVKKVGYPDKNDWIYSAHIRFGLRNWAFYGSYSFNPLFRSSASTKLNSIQFGLSISLF